MKFFDSSHSLNIVLVRACATDLDCQGRITGSLDMPLSDSGESDAHELAIELEGHDINAIVSANCLAAQQTAQQLARHGQIRVRVEDCLTNLDHGLWHGKSLEELKETQPKLFRQWQDNPESICPPGGETIDQVRVRVSIALRKIRRKHKSGTVAIVAPEPLLSIIRSAVEPSELYTTPLRNGSRSRWDEVSLASDVVV